MGSKTPTMKRILKEAAELAASSSPDYHAEPLESNLFEWHFTLRGPPSPSPYASGLYHGRISLPVAYPLRPPSFRFLTPSGRFEVNREICLSISGHHEETWQPAWGIRTALVAIRSFMDTDAKGQVGGLQGTEQGRKELAARSSAWHCPTCAKSNHQIMEEKGQVVKDMVDGTDGADTQEERKEDIVPQELRLGYRDELAQGTGESTTSQPTSMGEAARIKSASTSPPPLDNDSDRAAQSTQTVAIEPILQVATPPRPPRTTADAVLDTAIVIFATALGMLALKKTLQWLLS